MRRYLLFWAAVLVGVMGVSLLVSCRDDVVVEPPPSLIGNYAGIYSIRKHIADTDTSADTLREQLVTFRFTNSTFSMFMDTSVATEDRIFCDALGEYEMGTGVTLSVTDSNPTRALCTEMWAPTGSYSLDQTVEDVVMMRRLYTDGSAEYNVVLNLNKK